MIDQNDTDSTIRNESLSRSSLLAEENLDDAEALDSWPNNQHEQANGKFIDPLLAL